ncbi:hypothetical protein RJ639_043244 [Escallonia herrerae]|uniref:Aminotransferase-like plant mobile domain-containing protein n=1 Tax=Escallonia herrerae TaxID=1293975 RepID=A0AA89B136_9ASTE|nr:hypothetical protein RJ639_043244 [Escallonia herrerae]
MEGENGIDLRLALLCKKSPAIATDRNGYSLDARDGEVDRGITSVGDFKNFHDGVQKGDYVAGSQRSIWVKTEEYVDGFSKAISNVKVSSNSNCGGFGVANDNRSTETEEESRSGGIKCENLFTAINHQHRRENDADFHGNASASHIINFEGSTAENECVADSEAEGLHSRLDLHHVDGSQRCSRGSGFSELPKAVHGESDTCGVDLHGEKRPKLEDATDNGIFAINHAQEVRAFIKAQKSLVIPCFLTEAPLNSNSSEKGLTPGGVFKEDFPRGLKSFYPSVEKLPYGSEKFRKECERTVDLRCWPNPSNEWIAWVERMKPSKADLWRTLGIYDAIELSTYKIPQDKALIHGAMFFWSRSTNSFHFHCGPMAPTLQDVAALTGLRPHGDPVHAAMVYDSAKYSLPTEKRYGKDVIVSAYKTFINRSTRTGPVESTEHIAFLAYWINKYVLCCPSICMTQEPVGLAILLDSGRQMALGPLLLSHLYRGLHVVVEKGLKGFGGAFWVLQMWLHAYLPELAPMPAPNSTDEIYGYRYARGEPKEHTFEKCFKLLYQDDRTNRNFLPWKDRSLGPDWFRRSPSLTIVDADELAEHSQVWASYLVARDLHFNLQASPSGKHKAGAEWYAPNQLARQFGLLQLVPLPPYHSVNEFFHARKKLASTSEVTSLQDKAHASLAAFGSLVPFSENPRSSNHFNSWWISYMAAARSPIDEVLPQLLVQKPQQQKEKGDCVSSLQPAGQKRKIQSGAQSKNVDRKQDKAALMTGLSDILAIDVYNPKPPKRAKSYTQKGKVERQAYVLATPAILSIKPEARSLTGQVEKSSKASGSGKIPPSTPEDKIISPSPSPSVETSTWSSPLGQEVPRSDDEDNPAEIEPMHGEHQSGNETTQMEVILTSEEGDNVEGAEVESTTPSPPRDDDLNESQKDGSGGKTPILLVSRDGLQLVDPDNQPFEVVRRPLSSAHSRTPTIEQLTGKTVASLVTQDSDASSLAITIEQFISSFDERSIQSWPADSHAAPTEEEVTKARDYLGEALNKSCIEAIQTVDVFTLKGAISTVLASPVLSPDHHDLLTLIRSKFPLLKENAEANLKRCVKVKSKLGKIDSYLRKLKENKDKAIEQSLELAEISKHEAKLRAELEKLVSRKEELEQQNHENITQSSKLMAKLKKDKEASEAWKEEDRAAKEALGMVETEWKALEAKYLSL